MIVEGIKLTLLGIGFVFVFLSLLVVVIKLASRVLHSFTVKEETAYLAVPKKKLNTLRADEEIKRVMAVINAAIAAHRARREAETARPVLQVQQPSMPLTPPTLRPHVVPRQYAQMERPTDANPRSGWRASSLFFRNRSALGGFFRNR
ncbi:OadG family protein [Desulfobulbus rhabdoformis]|uniref:OadG family protein n=1 Tax=Desulfobulbus rhabdoformis TaxID=34032 RepID=UPI00196242D4|nr:OadG family protein [Desulfobulbus rhabdoformis]MBM9612717.1 OadG family protein [Desulfobulbus rhabdoformis]